MENRNYKYRNIAHIVIEAITPIAVGSGDKDFITDAPVLKDVNGLPYLPGTSIAGVVRHAIGDSEAKSFFGYNDSKNPENSIGSNIIFSNALMIGNDGNVVEGIADVDFNDSFYKHFKALPIRQHNTINAKGTVKNAGKFDEQVVYKGCRFCFEIEMLSKKENDGDFNRVLGALNADGMRLGGGTRSGFGEFNIVSVQKVELDLSNEKDLKDYVSKSSSLNDKAFWSTINSVAIPKNENLQTIKYELQLQPDDFFLFGSGFGSEDADMTPVRESVITWNGNLPKFEDEYVLIPATSVKGAISHRVAFHYNRLEEVFADTISKEEYDKYVGDNNVAVRALFGASGENNGNKQIRGNVMLSDVLLKKDNFKEKVLNHVSIDRFTGGAIDGALFQEEVLYGAKQEFSLVFLVESQEYKTHVIEAFEAALKDITTGMLPLGGGVNRGHGSFNGKILKNGNLLNN